MKLNIKINGRPDSIIVPDNANDQQITDLVNDLNKNTLPAPTKPDVGGYFKNLSKIVTEDVPAFNSYVGQGIERIGAPTVTSQIATNPAAKKQGSLAELVSGIPERIVREGGALARVPLGVMGLGMSAGNRLLGGLPGKAFDAYMQTPVARGLEKAGGRLASTTAGQDIYQAYQNPAIAATGGSMADMASLYSPGSIKGGINVAGKPVEAFGTAYERFGINKLPQVIKAKPSILEKVEGRNPLEKIKNFSQNIADYNLQGKINKPSELAAEAERLADIHNSNADASLAVSSLIGDRKINPLEVIKGVGDITKYAEIGKFPQYKLAYKKILSDLKEAGFKEGEQPVIVIKDIKSTLRPGIYGHGGAPNILDAPMADIKKRMITALNDAAEKAVPEAADFRKNNLQAKKLINIAEIAKNDEYNKLIKKPGWKEWVAGGGFGVAVPEIARFMGSTKMGSDDAIMGGLIGLGAIGAKKIITSPQMAIPVGRYLKSLGQRASNFGEEFTPTIRPGSKEGMKWKAPIMEGPGGSVIKNESGGRDFIIKKRPVFYTTEFSKKFNEDLNMLGNKLGNIQMSELDDIVGDLVKKHPEIGKLNGDFLVFNPGEEKFLLDKLKLELENKKIYSRHDRHLDAYSEGFEPEVFNKDIYFLTNDRKADIGNYPLLSYGNKNYTLLELKQLIKKSENYPRQLNDVNIADDVLNNFDEKRIELLKHYINGLIKKRRGN